MLLMRMLIYGGGSISFSRLLLRLSLAALAPLT